MRIGQHISARMTTHYNRLLPRQERTGMREESEDVLAQVDRTRSLARIA